MFRFLFVLLILSSTIVQAQRYTYSAAIYKIYRADQADRETGHANLSSRDSARRQKMDSILLTTEGLSGWDCFYAAMVFHHGPDTLCSRKAITYMKQAIESNSKINPWLFAAAVDRHLMQQNKAQIYGTQYIMRFEDSTWTQYQIDSTQITDKERMQFGVKTLAEQKAYLHNLQNGLVKPFDKTKMKLPE